MDTSQPEEKRKSTKEKMTTSALMKMAEAGNGLYFVAATAIDDDDNYRLLALSRLYETKGKMQ